MRLEDLTIEPEQLCTVVLYPNRSLGASNDAQVIDYRDTECPIRPFDTSVKLEDRPDFWNDVAIPHSGMWNMAEAAFKHGFSRCRGEAVVVVKNQFVSKRKMLSPHPKMDAGCVIFRNCLFSECEIMVDCWCGPRFHGCCFANCTFHFVDFTHTARAAKRCDIMLGARIVRGPRLDKKFTDVFLRQWLRENVGQETFEMDA